MTRRFARTILVLLAFLVGLVAALMVFAQDRIFDADSFSTTVASTLEDPAVNDYVAETISDALIDEAPDLAIGGPLLADVTGSLLESDLAVGIVESAAAEAHRTVFDGGGNTLALEVSDLVVSIEQALLAVSPDLAEAIPTEVTDLSVSLSSGELTAGTVRLAEQLRTLTIVLVIVASLLLIAVAVLDPSLFHGLTSMGLVLGAIGLALVILQASGEVILASYGRNELEYDALVGAWNVVLGDLATWGWVLVVIGALIAALGWAASIGGDVIAAVSGVVNEWMHTESRVGLLGRSAVALIAATWMLINPASFLSALVRIGGFGLAVIALTHVAGQFGIADRLRRFAPDSPSEVVPLSSIARRSVFPVLLIFGVGVVGAALLANDNDASALADPAACNGHVELCDRRLDEVTMAASHNSMSSTATGFYLPNHLTTMRAQLDQGVRGFMIDTVYGRPAADGSVRTSTEPNDNSTLGPDARAAAEAVQARQTADLGDETVYLCHGFCEIGSVDAVEELRIARNWLDEHPREVLVFVVQDATSPEDTAAMFDEAGFADLVHTQALDEPFPTLGAMIESGRRVFVMVEVDGGSIPWLHPAFTYSQETPFSFSNVDEFSCAPNRGEPDSPLFVINHFITLARPSNQTINDLDVLLSRVEQCRDERGLHPNLISVDFVSEGDVMEVVDRLNEVDD